MGCRCVSIRNCENDIGKTSTIKSALTVEYSRCDSISNYLSAFASSTGVAIRLQNISALTAHINKMNDFQANELPGLITSCETRLRELNTELVSMRREDYDYHNPPSKEGA